MLDLLFLAHLSQRLKRWAYRMAMRQHPSVIHNFKDHFLWNHLANQSQNFLGSGNEKSLYKWSRSQDQDGRHGYK